MTAEQLIKDIKIYLSDGCIQDVLEELVTPTSQSPTSKEVSLSIWYNQLNDSQKDFIHYIIKESIENSIFGFLCILDGVRSIEDADKKGEKGDLELYYVKGQQRILLNNSDNEFLHDIFKSEIEN
jgi:hypothetical protein